MHDELLTKPPKPRPYVHMYMTIFSASNKLLPEMGQL